MSQYLDDGPTGQHRPVGLVNAIAMQNLPCAESECPTPACAICWECVGFYCFEHAVEHDERSNVHTP